MNSLYRRIVTMGMISFTAVLAWVYCILTYRDKPVYIATVSLVLVISVYALLNAFVGLRVTKDAKLQNYIYETITATLSKMSGDDNSEEMEKLSKASYVQLRKSNTLLKQMAEEISKNYNQSMEIYNELNASMVKTVADSVNKAVKIIVKYNQADNEKLISAVNDFASALDRISAELSTVKNEIANIQISIPAQAEANSNLNTFTDNTNADEDASPDLSSFFAEFTDNEADNTSIDSNIEADTLSDSDTVAAELEDNPNKQLSPEEIAVLFEASKEEHRARSNDDFQIHDHPESMDQSLIDALLNNMADEITQAEEDNQADSGIADVIPFPTAEINSDSEDDTAITDNTPAEPDFDPNKQLSADEIAALFASMNPASTATDSDMSADSGQQETVTESESVSYTDDNSSDSAQAEAVPLNDNPNRQLSPEEIAALFASVR